MKPETIDLLRSPIGYELLKLVIEIQNGVPLECLVRVASGEVFAVEAGMPELLDQQRVVGYKKVSGLLQLELKPGDRRMLKKFAARFMPPVDLLPEAMNDVQSRDITNDGLYCMTFRKP